MGAEDFPVGFLEGGAGEEGGGGEGGALADDGGEVL